MIIDYRKDLKKSSKDENQYNPNIDYGNMSKQKFINKLNKYLVQEFDKKVSKMLFYVCYVMLC